MKTPEEAIAESLVKAIAELDALENSAPPKGTLGGDANLRQRAASYARFSLNFLRMFITARKNAGGAA